MLRYRLEIAGFFVVWLIAITPGQGSALRDRGAQKLGDVVTIDNLIPDGHNANAGTKRGLSVLTSAMLGGALERAIALAVLVKLERLAAIGAFSGQRLGGSSVALVMAGIAQSNAIINVIAQFGHIGPRLNMVSRQSSASLAAILTGVIALGKHGLMPDLVLIAGSLAFAPPLL